jgi:phosphopantetheine adenylyltransferase
MRKPIYRVIVDFEYRNKGKGNYIKTKIIADQIDTFALSRDEDEIYNHIKSKIFRQIKKKEDDVNIEIKNINIEGRYGETNY